MAQADQTIQNATFPTVRADINSNLAALFSDNSGNIAPTVTVAYQDWIDTSGTNPIWKKRNAANNAWITLGTIIGSTIAFQGTLPDQTSNSGKYLGTNGTVASWSTVPSISVATTGQAQAGTDNTVAISPLRLREGLNASGSAPVYACRAWVNFNGTGTVAIRASGNVSSITDNGVGDYTVNFSTAMPDANYILLSNTGSFTTTDPGGAVNIKVMTTSYGSGSPSNKTASVVRVVAGATGKIDGTELYVAIFR